jgi:hypothetical protein
MAGPCKEKCQLSEDAAVIKADMAEVKVSHNDTQKIVNGMAVEFGKMSQKLDSYMERGKDEHDVLFAKTRENAQATGKSVKWPHLLMVLTAISIIVGITWKFAAGG